MNRLIKAAIAVTTVFSCSTASAADCGMTSGYTDPFTKKTIVVTDFEQMTKDVSDKFKHPKGFVGALRNGNQKYIVIQMRTWDESSAFSRNSSGPMPPDNYLYNAVVADEGSKLKLLLADETIIELETDRTVHGIASSMGIASNNMSREIFFNIRTNIALRYELDDDAYAALTSYPVKNIRLSTNGRDHDLLLRKEPYGGINRAITCIGPDPVAEEEA
jgi:hypothetical protein